jgi:hypothetical protein
VAPRSPDRHFAGGFCELQFESDPAGHGLVTIQIADDTRVDQARVSFSAEAAGVDRFVSALCSMERSRSGEAILPAVP